MGLFRKRNNRVLDLTKGYERRQARAEEIRQDTPESRDSSECTAGGLGFFGAIGQTVSNQSSSEDSGYVDFSSSAEEKKRKLAKRLMEMTNKIEELSNQIYHLQQRVELLEKKSNI